MRQVANREDLVIRPADVESKASRPIETKRRVEARGIELHASPSLGHPIYSDGSLILIGDSVRSYDTEGPKVYEGTVVGVTSTSILCYPPYECQLNFGTCDQIYLVQRSPKTTAGHLSQLNAIRAKLHKDVVLSTDDRQSLLAALSSLEHRPQR